MNTDPFSRDAQRSAEIAPRAPLRVAAKRCWVFFVILLYISVCPTSSAAPPTLTSLFPTGVQQGKTIDVSAQGKFERWPVQGWADHHGIQIVAAKEKGKLSLTAAADTPPGIHWLRLHDEQGASTLRPFFVDTLPEIVEREPNDEPRQAQMLASSAVVNGRLEQPGDVDCFALKLQKGQTLVASLTANRVLGSPFDAVLQVLSADGFLLEENNDYHGLDPQLAFTAPRDGTYVVRTFGFPAVPDSGIRLSGAANFIYRLTLTTGAFVDHALPLAVQGAKPATVELFGWNIPPAAKTITVEPGAGSDRLTLSHPLWANTINLRRQPYTVCTRTAPTDRAHPQVVPVPCIISGRIDAPDGRDFYEFEARKGQNLLFQVEASTFGSPLTPVFRVFDAAGKTLAQSGDAPTQRRRRGTMTPAVRPSETDTEATFTAPADGKYRVEIRDLFATGSWQHVYALRALLPEPEYELRLDTDRWTLTPGKPLEITVTIESRQGFAGEVEVQAVNLPKGMTAPPVRVKGGTAVKLVLTAARGDFSGPFQIVGRAASRPAGLRTATALIPDPAATTPYLWVTAARPENKPAAPKK